MSSFDSKLREIHPKTQAGWRSWLKRNHAKCDGVWLIYYRASTGKSRLSWEDAVREALCFGWIDSKVKPIDDERYKQIFTPRKPRSVWSKINKQHISELIDVELMTDAGLRAVDVAKKNGAWSLLEPVDALIVPPDLESALRRSKRARARRPHRAPRRCGACTFSRDCGYAVPSSRVRSRSSFVRTPSAVVRARASRAFRCAGSSVVGSGDETASVGGCPWPLRAFGLDGRATKTGLTALLEERGMKCEKALGKKRAICVVQPRQFVFFGRFR